MCVWFWLAFGVWRKAPLELVVLEFKVSLRPREDDVDPDPHGLRRRGHQVVGPVRRLHAEGNAGVGGARTVQVVHVDLLNGLETGEFWCKCPSMTIVFVAAYPKVNAPLGPGLGLVSVVDEALLLPVEDKPSPVPYPAPVEAARGAHLAQVAPAGAGVKHQVPAARVAVLVHLVARRLDMLAQVEGGTGGLTHREVASQRSLLQEEQKFGMLCADQLGSYVMH